MGAGWPARAITKGACGAALAVIGLILAACDRQPWPDGAVGPSSIARDGAVVTPAPSTVATRASLLPGDVLASPAVIGDAAALPPSCQPDQVAHLVMRFFDAVNRGDQEQIDQVFAIAAGPAAQTPQGWYSVSESPLGQDDRQFVAYTQGDLLAYFQGRHRQRERLRLVRLQVQGPMRDEYANINYNLRRSADDLGPGEHAYGGKGAINCARQQLFVWSMSDKERVR